VEEIMTRPPKVLVDSLELTVAQFEIPDRGQVEAPGPDSINTVELLIRTESKFAVEITCEDLQVKLIGDPDLPAENVRQCTALAGNPTGRDETRRRPTWQSAL
jgi:acyl carrier protein